ncbi:MAG TPA: hypothetical protein VFO15_11980 [Xanthobacteraceae bacterium]|nr:hypothetical protein [Xanthobacteraceae bacterium]
MSTAKAAIYGPYVGRTEFVIGADAQDVVGDAGITSLIAAGSIPKRRNALSSFLFFSTAILWKIWRPIISSAPAEARRAFGKVRSIAVTTASRLLFYACRA